MKLRILFLGIVVVVGVFGLVGCQRTYVTQSPLSPLPSPTNLPVFKVPTSEPGKVTVTGRVISTFNDKPLSDYPVWVAEVLGEGEEQFFVLDTGKSLGAYTNAEGFFAILNVPYGSYVIVVGDPYSQPYEIISETQGSERAKVWVVRENSILDVGEIKVSITGR